MGNTIKKNETTQQQQNTHNSKHTNQYKQTETWHIRRMTHIITTQKNGSTTHSQQHIFITYPIKHEISEMQNKTQQHKNDTKNKHRQHTHIYGKTCDWGTCGANPPFGVSHPNLRGCIQG